MNVSLCGRSAYINDYHFLPLQIFLALSKCVHFMCVNTCLAPGLKTRFTATVALASGSDQAHWTLNEWLQDRMAVSRLAGYML